MTPAEDIVLAGSARFHIPHLATAFADLGRLREVSLVTLRPDVPERVKRHCFRNNWMVAGQRKLRARLGMPSDPTTESRDLGADLARRLVVQRPGILHAWNGVATEAFSALGGTDWTLCLERSCPHNLYQYNLLLEEGDRLGFPHREDIEGLRRSVGELYLADVIAVPSLYSARSYTDPELVRKLRRNSLGANYKCEARRSKTDGVFRILMVGNDFLRKGSHYLIQAFLLLDLPNSELIIRGQIPAAYRKPVRDPRVKFVDEMSPAGLRALYASADVFVQPSIDEGFGMTVLEALSYGLPVVITENVGCRDVLNDAVSRTVPIRDPEALAKAILEARHLPGVVFDHARQNILEVNSWAACAERMIAEVYGKPGPSSDKRLHAGVAIV